MANAKKKKNYRDSIEGMGKREINALNKEIRAHYKEHGWRKTVSVYKVAPTDLSEIVDPDGKNKAKKKKPDVKPAAAKKKAAKKKAPKKKAAKKAPKKKAAKKKEAPKKKPGRPKKKAAEPPKKAKKKLGNKGPARRKTNKPKKVIATETDGVVLDWLLSKRASMSAWDRKEVTLEQVIVDLTAHVRGV